MAIASTPFPTCRANFGREWHRALRQVYPHMTTVGEVMNGDPVDHLFFAGGRAQNDGIDSGVTAVFDYPFYYALREGLLENNSPARIVRCSAEDHLYPHPECWSLSPAITMFRASPARKVSRSTKSSSPFRWSSPMRGTPELYYGDEIGMTGGDDPDNRHDFPGGFPGDKQERLHSIRPHARTAGNFLARTKAAEPAQRSPSSSPRPALAHLLGPVVLRIRAHHQRRTAPDRIQCGAGAKTMHLSFASTPLQGAQKLTPLLGKHSVEISSDDCVDFTLAPDELEIFSDSMISGI